jgi:hypothetical protein
VADFESKLRWLSERGNPVGAEELIERIEADLAEDPLVVVAKRREGTLMTKTQQSPRTSQSSRYRGPVWAVAASVAVVVAAAGLFLAFSGDRDEVADIPPPSTTVAPDVETMTDLEVVEAGVAAFYSGDAERAVQLFELSDRDDDEIRGEAAYQAAIGGRLTLDCQAQDTPGVLSCRTRYHNGMTDAIGFVDSGNTSRIVIEDGLITEFAFPRHTFIAAEMGVFLFIEGSFEGYESCAFGPLPESCATIQMENLDAWVEWRENWEPADVVEVALESWYGGDCHTARFFSGPSQPFEGADLDCSTSSTPSQTIEYESILGAQVSVENCEETAPAASQDQNLSCEVHYTNAMNSAVGKPPSVTARRFTVVSAGFVRQPGGGNPWYQGDYPEDTELRESFRLFAEGGELRDEYEGAGCASARTPECANLILGNLDGWAAWYQTNS